MEWHRPDPESAQKDKTAAWTNCSAANVSTAQVDKSCNSTATMWTVLVVTTAMVLCSLVVLRLQSPISRLPGPWYTALTGMVLIYHEYRGSRRLYVHDLHHRYGATVRLSPGEVSCTGASAVRSIFGVGNRGLDKPRLFDLFTQRGTRNMFTCRRKVDHARARRRLAARYTNSAILDEQVITAVKERADAFVTKSVESVDSRGHADIYRLLHAFALDCVTHVLFAPFGTKAIDDARFRAMIDTLSYHDSRKSQVIKHRFPGLHSLWSWAARPKTKESGQLDAYVEGLTCGSKHTANFTISSTLRDADLSDQAVFAECADHLFAGVETTGDTLCFLIWHMSQPAGLPVQRRLQEEIRECPLSQAQIHQLPYLNAVVDEALRLFTAAAISLTREVGPEGLSVNEYPIPPGTVVGCQPFTVHRCEETYPRPEEFIPERWLSTGDGVDGRRKKHDPADRTTQYLAFGTGARSCIGKNLARAEMRQLLYAVYSQYSTLPSEEMSENNRCMDMADQILTVRPRDTICLMRFKKL